MKISKLLNEKRIIGQFAYLIFKVYHKITNYFSNNVDFDFLNVKSPKVYIPYHPNPESNLFGHIELFKTYLNNKLDLLNVHIQHGVILGKLVQDIMINSFADTIITFSEKRKLLIQNSTDKNIIAVGPYIRYAQNRLSIKDFNNLKNKYGKILLVFPAHSSVDRTKISFDQLSLINKIKELVAKYNIKTVFINLFYSDCNKQAIDFYEQEGFKVCSAGYWLSKDFLPNLRTIIELSDFTMSNRMGTHIGYCLALNKPHYIFKQEHNEEFIGLKGKEDLEQTLTNEYYSKIDSDRIESVFRDEKFIISNEQIEIVNEFWGNDIFLSPEEIIDVVTFLRHDKTK